MISNEQFGKLVETMQNMNNTVGALIKEVERLEEEKQILADELLNLRRRVDAMDPAHNS